MNSPSGTQKEIPDHALPLEEFMHFLSGARLVELRVSGLVSNGTVLEQVKSHVSTRSRLSTT